MEKDLYFLTDKEKEELVAEVRKDFEERQRERKNYELQWQLNTNFLLGNQYSVILNNQIESFDKQYYWQERQVYNHIAPTIEARISKLEKVRPKPTVIPSTDSENDINSAKISKNILNAVIHKLSLGKSISMGTIWSEICGTVIYKIIWNKDKGRVIAQTDDGKNVNEGEIEVEVCPPYEIFPDNNNVQNIDDCMSIIHARPYSVEQILSIWGEVVNGEEIDVFTLSSENSKGGTGYTLNIPKVISSKKKDSCLVIERYQKPTKKYPAGRLTIVAGDKLLYYGELPYMNRADGTRSFPFVKQCSIEVVSSFWGVSIIERLIPIQRAYNAVKNRKHEFINRLTTGIIIAEDGSIDADELAEEGLAPGKIIVYRQGATPPKVLEDFKMPSEFTLEEDRLLNEFITISGVSDMMLNSKTSAVNLSGTALELIMEQDSSRMQSTVEQIRVSIKEIAQQILRLYKQFAKISRVEKIVGTTGSIDMFYWSGSDINSDDIMFETENEYGETMAQKRNMIFELLNTGLLQDENGKMSNRMRNKTLEKLGLGLWDTQFDLDDLQLRKAGKENLELINTGNMPEVSDIDDDRLHIDEHIAFMLSEEFDRTIKNDKEKSKVIAGHIEKHKARLNKINELKEIENGK